MLWHSTRLRLPFAIEESYKTWQSDFSAFLQQPKLAKVDFNKSPVTQLYELISGLDPQSVEEQILRRFLLLLVYRSRKRWSRDLSKSMTRSISSVQKKKNVRHNWTLWHHAGERYAKLSDQLNGQGAVILLDKSRDWSRLVLQRMLIFYL